jgi:hypothetical protein
MLGKLICMWKGKHERGKLVRVEEGMRVTACPRCGREIKRGPVPPKAPPPQLGAPA